MPSHFCHTFRIKEIITSSLREAVFHIWKLKKVLGDSVATPPPARAQDWGLPRVLPIPSNKPLLQAPQGADVWAPNPLDYNAEAGGLTSG